jgi:DNA repair protein RecN (Recombination protein N)
MLLSLRIQDFVIVEQQNLNFEAGFTVLTGETGAGKSMLIDALALLLGGRAEAGVVRAGAARAEIEACFSLDAEADGEARTWLTEQDLSGDDDLLLMRRVVDAGGRSRAFINGRAVTLTQLKILGEWLVDIHGQHAHQSLVRPEIQRQLLDGFAGATDAVKQVREAFRHWQSVRQQRQDWENNASAFSAERERLLGQVEELQSLELSREEWPQLQQEHSRLANAAGLIEGSDFALQVLAEADDACLSRLAAAQSRISALAELDPSLQGVLGLLNDAEAPLREASYELRHYRQKAELDPQRLNEVEQRIQTLYSTARKYRCQPDNLPERLEQYLQRLVALGGDEAEPDWAGREAEALQRWQQLAGVLTGLRQQAAITFAGRITTEMQALALAGSRFAATLLPRDEPTAYGAEEVVFEVAQHDSLPLRPLAKVASGGELSRISLALQMLTSEVAAVPTLIFDEVDVGIGGRVAEMVGRLLKRLGLRYQVLCITHLPQVAALGDQQWQVSKLQTDDGVRSQIAALTAAQRIDEIARMLGGVDITDTTRQHAKELLAG